MKWQKVYYHYPLTLKENCDHVYREKDEHWCIEFRKDGKYMCWHFKTKKEALVEAKILINYV